MRRLICTAVVFAITGVNGFARAEDNTVAQQIAQRLHTSGQLKGYSVGVKHKAGTVWLKGEVADAKQAAAAIRIAKGTPNVAQVVNNLSVRGGQEPTPAVRPVAANGNRPQPVRPMQRVAARQESVVEDGGAVGQQPMPMYAGAASGNAPAVYDQPNMPSYAWPSYASYPNYAAVSYPKQYSPMAWPYIGPFYPYPQVPLGWRKVTLEWDDGWWMLDFAD